MYNLIKIENNMKKIMIVALALLMGLASCVKDKQYPGINISNVSYAPTAVQADDDVTVTATITSFKDFTAKLVYSTDAASKAEELGMVAGEENTYTAVIPAMPNGTKVSFYVQAMNGEVTAVSPTMEYAASTNSTVTTSSSKSTTLVLMPSI